MRIKFDIVCQSDMVARFASVNEVVNIYHCSDYGGDGFGTLLNNLWRLKTDFDSVAIWNYPFQVVWKDDFIDYVWECIPQFGSRQIVFTITAKYEDEKTPDEQVVTFNISYAQLFEDIFQSLDQMYHTFRLIGYWEVYGWNFSIGEYLTLKAEGEQKVVRLADADEDDEWRKRRVLDDEISILRMS